MKTFATEAFLAIKFMERNRPDLRVGGPPTVQYMDYNKEWDDEASSEDINEFEQYAKKHLKKLDRRMKSIAARSKRELMTEKTNNSS
jgi:hypothetical protein